MGNGIWPRADRKGSTYAKAISFQVYETKVVGFRRLIKKKHGHTPHAFPHHRPKKGGTGLEKPKYQAIGGIFGIGLLLLGKPFKSRNWRVYRTKVVSAPADVSGQWIRRVNNTIMWWRKPRKKRRRARGFR